MSQFCGAPEIKGKAKDKLQIVVNEFNKTAEIYGKKFHFLK
jgi:hypothetical protein